MAHASERAAGARIGEFVATAVPPKRRRERARRSRVLDTVGVTLAGVTEPASTIVRQMTAAEGGDACTVFGTPHRAGASAAALANGTAAHALDFDDMCFVSLAHPSAPLVAALLAAGGVCRRIRRVHPRRLRRRLRGRSAARQRAQSAALSARLALHRHAGRRRRGGRREPRAGPGRRRDRARAGDRRVHGVRTERELRHDGEAAARRPGGAQRGDGGVSGARRSDRERHGARRAAGPAARDGRRAVRVRRIARRSRPAMGNSGDRHHREALPVVRRHPSVAGRHPGSAPNAKGSARTRSSGSTSTSTRSRPPS